jgi:hypothetical protein
LANGAAALQRAGASLVQLKHDACECPHAHACLDALVSQAERRGKHLIVIEEEPVMAHISRISLAGLLALALAACATTPPPDLTPPPAKRLDAKTTLENRM